MIQKTKIGYKTIQFFTDKGARCVMFHDTVIFRQRVDGTIELNSGGFKTATTLKKINQQLPPSLYVYQKSYKWYVQISPSESNPLQNDPDSFIDVPFVDGMQLVPSDSFDSYIVKESRE